MFDTNPKSHNSGNIIDLAALEAENKLLHKELEELRQQSESVAKANAYAAELMVKLEELNDDLKIEIERRKLAEEKLQHAHDELEVKVKERTAELAAAVERLTIANRELKEFAYIAAHDLKSPVRAIGSLAGMISNECRDMLTEQCKEELDMLVQRTERMNEFINGILEYATIGHVALQKERVDTNNVVNWVIEHVGTQKEAIEITMGKELPIIMVQRAHITQIFQNLLDNAVKYMDKPNGQIRIDCVEKDDFWEFSVADNGPGIEEKYFDKIFQIFQTLTRRDEIEATGIGLSVVRKIVELYGGKIWLKSKISEGSTFFFTLPKQETGVKN